jgi:hypothetical protein
VHPHQKLLQIGLLYALLATHFRIPSTSPARPFMTHDAVGRSLTESQVVRNRRGWIAISHQGVIQVHPAVD